MYNTSSGRSKKRPIKTDPDCRSVFPLSDPSRACYLCGTLVKEWKSFNKHLKSQICMAHHAALITPGTNVASTQLPVDRVFQPRRKNISQSCAMYYEGPEVEALKELAFNHELPNIDGLVTAAIRYYHMSAYLKMRENVNFSLSTFLMDTPDKTINRPNNLIVIDTPLGSLMECIQFLVFFLTQIICFVFF
jgi:hypothetical protein